MSQVDRLETHGNLVFLAGEDAWKIKRAVRFPYMDFSTLERRRVACAREVEVNRRLAPDFYLGCVPITRTAKETLAFGGDGDIVEWAVHMRRFDQSSLLSSIAAADGIDADLAKAVADAVYESHRGAPSVASASGTTKPCRAGRLDLQRARAAPTRSPARTPAPSRAMRTSQLERASTILNRRAEVGCVRRCHGDLHLANIVLWQGRPMLFDAIEFDEKIATIDTLYDLAFLLMDLRRYGQARAANVVLNRYLWRSQNDLDLTACRRCRCFSGCAPAFAPW